MKQLVVAMLVALASATGAQAALVQVLLEGTVGNTFNTSAVSLGEPVQFELVYDTSVPATSFNGTLSAEYPGAFISATAQVGGQTFTAASAASLQVSTLLGLQDVFRFRSEPFGSVFGANTLINISLTGPTLFPDASLPTGPLSFTDFSGSTLNVSDGSAVQSVGFTVQSTSISLAPVPLPAGLGLLITALGAAALARRRA